VDLFEAGVVTPTQQAVSHFQAGMSTAWQNLAYQVHGTMLPHREVDAALKEAATALQALQALVQLNDEDELMLRLITSTLRLEDTVSGNAAPSAASAGTEVQAQQDLPAATPEPPAEFVCPISLEVMSDPVMLVESGQVFDKRSIT
jgi:hypothetical protein